MALDGYKNGAFGEVGGNASSAAMSQVKGLNPMDWLKKGAPIPSSPRLSALSKNTALKAPDIAEQQKINRLDDGIDIAEGAMDIYSGLRGAEMAAQSAFLNGKKLESQARTTLLAATMNVDKMRKDARRTIGEQLAQGAESGLELTGSRLDALRESYQNLNEDTAAVMTDANLVATGLKKQAMASYGQIKQIKKTAKLQTATSALKTGFSVGQRHFSK